MNKGNPLPTLALLVEFDRILLGEAKADDSEYHELVVTAIRSALERRDQEHEYHRRVREIFTHLLCPECKEMLRETGAQLCQTHIVVRLIFDGVNGNGARTAPQN